MNVRTLRILLVVTAASLLLGACGRVGTGYVDQLENVAASSAADGAEADSTDGVNTDDTGAEGSAHANVSEDGSPAAGASAAQSESSASSAASPEMEVTVETLPEWEEVSFNWSGDWDYAEESKIHTDTVRLYHAPAEVRNGIVVTVNAGHGCAGGESEQTYCHPDHTPKVTGGSTSSGSVTATAINSGMTFNDGTKEADAVLELAGYLKEELLKKGFDVLMIRERDEAGDGDAQLDNIARTLFANNIAKTESVKDCRTCHVSLHYDSTDGDKGLFYIRVPDVASYKNMETLSADFEGHPLWEEHDRLGEAILQGAEEAGVRIYSSGSIALDLTQTSYSTVPSVDVEVGDKGSDHSEAAQRLVAEGIASGMEGYFAGNEAV